MNRIIRAANDKGIRRLNMIILESFHSLTQGLHRSRKSHHDFQ